jgi:hypothetical protein
VVGSSCSPGTGFWSVFWRCGGSIIGTVLLALVLVAGVHPLTGSLRRRGARTWLAATRHPDRAGGRDPRPRGTSLALSVAQLFEVQWAARSRPRPAWAEPGRFTETLGLSATLLAASGPARITPSSPAQRPAPTPNWPRANAPWANALSRRKHDER